MEYFEFSICVFRNIWYCVYIAAGEWTESPTNQKRVSCVTGLPARTKHRSCRLFLLATIWPLTGGPEPCLVVSAANRIVYEAPQMD